MGKVHYYLSGTFSVILAADHLQRLLLHQPHQQPVHPHTKRVRTPRLQTGIMALLKFQLPLQMMRFSRLK